MQKLSVRYGCMLLWGRLLPAGPMEAGLIWTLAAPVEYCLSMLAANKLPAGLLVVAASESANKLCECAPICDWFSVTTASPPTSPIFRGVRPAPLPHSSGTFPWRFGKPKVLFPSPPKFVPSSENRAVFCDIGISCPLHIAQPSGAK